MQVIAKKWPLHEKGVKFGPGIAHVHQLLAVLTFGGWREQGWMEKIFLLAGRGTGDGISNFERG